MLWIVIGAAAFVVVVLAVLTPTVIVGDHDEHARGVRVTAPALRPAPAPLPEGPAARPRALPGEPRVRRAEPDAADAGPAPRRVPRLRAPARPLADEAFGFAVCLWTAGSGAEVADAEASTSERVDRRDVGAAVVGEDTLDRDAVAGEELDRPGEEADRGRGFLIVEDLGVGEAAVIVDGDVDEVPAGQAAVVTVCVALPGSARTRCAVADAFACDLEPSELLDIDVYELPGLERS